jgi:uncharacterized protein YggE
MTPEEHADYKSRLTEAARAAARDIIDAALRINHDGDEAREALDDAADDHERYTHALRILDSGIWED